jgi:phenylalanyl-tRNA synthetase alpha chain
MTTLFRMSNVQDAHFLLLFPFTLPMLTCSKLISYSVAKGPKFSLTIEKQATDLTAEMLADGSWKTLTFKKYNFAGNPPSGGHLHPLMKVREEFRKIFFELGYVLS